MAPEPATMSVSTSSEGWRERRGGVMAVMSMQRVARARPSIRSKAVQPRRSSILCRARKVKVRREKMVGPGRRFSRTEATCTCFVCYLNRFLTRFVFRRFPLRNLALHRTQRDRIRVLLWLDFLRCLLSRRYVKVFRPTFFSSLWFAFFVRGSSLLFFPRINWPFSFSVCVVVTPTPIRNRSSTRVFSTSWVSKRAWVLTCPCKTIKIESSSLLSPLLDGEVIARGGRWWNRKEKKIHIKENN